MKTVTRFGMFGLVAVALGSVLFWNGNSNAGGDEAKRMKSVDEIADAVKGGKMDAVKSMAKKLAEKEEEVYYIMLTMKPRDKKGFGVGKAADNIVPDGIELKIQAMARDVMSGAKLKKEADALTEMTHRINAIAHFAENLPPKKDKGMATKKKWLDLSKDMQEGTVELEKAIKSGAPATVKAAASKLNANCNNCHSLFR